MSNEKNTAREVNRLRSENAQLKVLARRYQLLQRKQRNAPVTRPGVPAPTPQPFELVDPRRVPVKGTKVLAPLNPPIMLGKQMGAAIVTELRAMTIETRALVRALAKGPEEQLSNAMDAPDDFESVTDRAHRRLEEMQAKWKQRFANLAEEWSSRMIEDVVAQSSAQLNLGLKDVAERMAIQSTMATPRMRAVVQAATQASAGLIKRIPEEYLGEVQTQVMSAITTGSGLDKLVPYLTKRYEGDARRAQLVALDQVRKASANVNGARLIALGVKNFIWVHTGGERYPRELHQRYSGKEFDYATPPVIDEKTDETGLPGSAINCRCVARPVLRFAESD